MLEPDPIVRCKAKTRDGDRCQHYPMRGQQVCHMHGGKSPQALISAEERMRALVHPSLERLKALISHADNDAVSLNALKYVLDYAGFKAAEKVNADGKVVIEVEYVGRAPTVIDVPVHTNGHVLEGE